MSKNLAAVQKLRLICCDMWLCRITWSGSHLLMQVPLLQPRASHGTGLAPAIERGYHDVARLLLQAGVAANTAAADGTVPLATAAQILDCFCKSCMHGRIAT